MEPSTAAIDLVAIVLSVVALLVTVIGFFASLKFYRDGNEALNSARGVLSRIEERTASISSHVGGMFAKTLDAALGRANPTEAREEQSRVIAARVHDKKAATDDRTAGPESGGTKVDDGLARSVMEYFAFRKLRYSDVSNDDARAIFLLGADHGFNLFNGVPGIVFLGYFHDLSPAVIVARVRFLLHNIESAYIKIDEDPTVPHRHEALRILGSMKIEVLVPQQAPADRMLAKINEYQPAGRSVPVVLRTASEIRASVKAEYEAMGL